MRLIRRQTALSAEQSYQLVEHLLTDGQPDKLGELPWYTKLALRHFRRAHGLPDAAPEPTPAETAERARALTRSRRHATAEMSPA